jgi:hypothetical protein
MPPPGPCDAKALPAESATAHAAATAAHDIREFFCDMTISRDDWLDEVTDQARDGLQR